MNVLACLGCAAKCSHRVRPTTRRMGLQDWRFPKVQIGTWAIANTEHVRIRVPGCLHVDQVQGDGRKKCSLRAWSASVVIAIIGVLLGQIDGFPW